MQEYLDNAKKFITSFTKKAVKKSSEVYENTKLSIKISNIKTDIEEEYKKIGKIVYEKYKGKEISSDDAEAICSKIDLLFGKIDDLNQKMAENKDVHICPACGAEVSPESTFCANCGEKIE